jgi:hypothetical protein
VLAALVLLAADACLAHLLHARLFTPPLLLHLHPALLLVGNQLLSLFLIQLLQQVNTECGR